MDSRLFVPTDLIEFDILLLNVKLFQVFFIGERNISDPVPGNVRNEGRHDF